MNKVFVRLIFHAAINDLGFVRAGFWTPLSGPYPALKHIFYTFIMFMFQLTPWSFQNMEQVEIILHVLTWHMKRLFQMVLMFLTVLFKCQRMEYHFA